MLKKACADYYYLAKHPEIYKALTSEVISFCLRTSSNFTSLSKLSIFLLNDV